MTNSARFWIQFLLLMSLTGTRSLVAQEASSLETISTEAFLSMMDGDQLSESGNTEAALEKYMESRDQYQRVQNQDETFKPRVVSIRLEQLDEKISALSPEEAPPPSEEPGFELGTDEEDFQELYLQAREQLAQETARISVLEKRMVEATTAFVAAREQLDEQSQELRQLRRQVDVQKAESRDVTKFNELLKRRSNEIEQENQKLVEERAALSVRVAEHDDQVAALQARLDETSAKLAEKTLSTNQSEQKLILERNQLRDDKAEVERQLEAQAQLMDMMEKRIEDVVLLEESVIVLNERNETQAKQIETLNQEVQELRKENLEKRQTASRLQQVVSGKRSQLEAANQKELEALRLEREELEKRNTDLQKRLGTTSLALKEQDDLIQALQAELQSTQSVSGPVLEE